jgi:hypothetical protein
MLQFRIGLDRARQAPLASGCRPGGPVVSQRCASFEASKFFDSPLAGFMVGLTGRVGTG